MYKLDLIIERKVYMISLSDIKYFINEFEIEKLYDMNPWNKLDTLRRENRDYIIPYGW